MKINSTKTRNVHDLLKQTVIQGDSMALWLMGDGEIMAKQLRPLCDYLHANAPEKLYRIRQFNETSIEALKQDRLYFTRADWFNDPYDCLLYFEPSRVKVEIEKTMSVENLKKAFFANVTASFFPLDKYIEMFEEYKKDIIEAVFSNYAKATSMLQKSTYVACLSETIESPIMWSHYGENHKGFAIEYMFDPVAFPPHPHISDQTSHFFYGWRSLLPVHYSTSRADATDLAMWFCTCELEKRLRPKEARWDEALFLPDMLLRTKLCLEKAETWAYEREWRSIMTFEWPYDAVDQKVYSNKKAAAIYLGERMEKDRREKLIQIANNKGIPAYEMYIDYTSREYVMKYRKV